MDSSQTYQKLLPQTELVFKVTPIHPSLGTYLSPHDTRGEHCLSLKCPTLALQSLHPNVQPPANISQTRGNERLAKHFLLSLMEEDRQKSLGSLDEVFGLAAMFQFYLDFWALAIKKSDNEEPPDFPASTGSYRNIKFSDEKGREKKENWRDVKSVKTDLRKPYWSTHPLATCKPILRWEDDREVWRSVGDVLSRAQQDFKTDIEMDARYEQDILVLASAMELCVFRLEKFHSKFSDRAKVVKNSNKCILL